MSQKVEPTSEEQDRAKFEQEEKLAKDKPYKCTLCEYRCKTPSLLSRHINHFHTEIKDRTPGHLLTVLNGKKSVPEMLVSVARWIEGATTFDDRLPDDVIAYLKREDAKTQLILRVIAIGKIQRAMELADRIKELDLELQEKVKDKKFKQEASPGTYLSLIERLQVLQKQELDFLKDIVQLGEVNLTDVIDKLVEAFGSARLGGKHVGPTAFQLTGITLPDDPSEREQIRMILRHLKTGELIPDGQHGGRDIEAEATVEESPGTDTQANPEKQEPRNT